MQRTSAGAASGVMRPIGLTRGQEYAIIASDMRRLLVVSAVLMAVMLVILVVAG